MLAAAPLPATRGDLLYAALALALLAPAALAWKPPERLGDAAAAPTLAIALGPNADAALNAVGVLEALGARAALERVVAAGGPAGEAARGALA